jgi:hypothetical protein
MRSTQKADISEDENKNRNMPKTKVATLAGGLKSSKIGFPYYFYSTSWPCECSYHFQRLALKLMNRSCTTYRQVAQLRRFVHFVPHNFECFSSTLSPHFFLFWSCGDMGLEKRKHIHRYHKAIHPSPSSTLHPQVVVHRLPPFTKLTKLTTGPPVKINNRVQVLDF